MQKAKTVLVTGIGGNVGQGIIRNIVASGYPIKIIGTNTVVPTVANYLCHKVYKVPYAYDQGYIKRVIEICDVEKVDLIVPSTDYETLYLSRHSQKLPGLAAINAETSEILIDKYKTSLEFSKRNIPFAKSCLPSAYQQQFDQNIVKPREGRGSRGISINPERMDQFDDSYVVQELQFGTEITTAFYVDRSGQCLSHISMERSLENGATVFTKVIDYLDDRLDKIIVAMIQALEIKGACNIQFIHTADDKIVPFEINGRISGTNSIRANFGFTDVVWTLEEHLYGKKLQPPKLKKGVATRILMDVIYPELTNFDEIDNQAKHIIY